MLTSLILGLLAQGAPVPAVATFNVTTNSTYGNTQLNWDGGNSRWVGCLSRPFRYTNPGTICGTTSGTAIIRLEMDNQGMVTMRWNAGAGGVCAVDATCNGTFAYRNMRVYAVDPGPPWTAAARYNALSGGNPPFLGNALITITAP